MLAPGYRHALLVLLCGLWAATPARADITVQATVNPRRAEVGETITLSIEINGAQNVGAPALPNLDGFDAQYVGPSTQISIVNGQMNAQVQHRYALTPQRPGHFTLGPFSLEYQGKRYDTAAFGIDVVPAGQAAGGQGQQRGGGQALRLTLSVPQQDVYLHQRIPVDITLYVGDTQVADIQFPTLPGDGLSLDKFPQPSQRQETIDGQTFQVLHFQTEAIPLRAGAVALGPATLRLNTLARRRGNAFNDPFFDAFNTERRPLDLHSDPLTLNVLPLPEKGRPPGFSGAIGTFTMQVTAGPTEVTAGDPVTVHMQVNGTGNLGDANPPALTDTAGFRTYEPHTAKSDDATKSFEQVIIPNEASVHAVPSVRFSYFDPQTRQYRTLESQPIALVVRPPQNAPHTDVVAGGVRVPRAAPEEKLGRDIVYIKDDPGGLVMRGGAWYRSLAFLLWQPLPLLLFIGAVWYDRHRQRLSGDVRYARFTRAGKDARTGLGAAERALAQNDRQAFYDAVSRTMQAYLGAKLDLPPGGIDANAITARGIPVDCVERLNEFFVRCEHVRFAPSAGDGDMRGTLTLAKSIIERLERERRLGSVRRGTARAAAVVLALTVLSAIAAVGADEAPASPQTTFFHANALYKDGQYAEAASEYDALRSAGLQSGNLYFNLGNAYFKAGEKGKAILNYERARHLMPGDPDVQANLTYAQSLTSAEDCVPAMWERLIFPLAYRLAIGGLVWTTSVAYSLLLFSLATYRLWPRRPRWLLYLAGAFAVVVVLASTSLAQQWLVDDTAHQAVIIDAGETAARFEPAANGTVHFALKEGTRVHLLDSREGWWQIARCDGRRGWIPKTSAEAL